MQLPLLWEGKAPTLLAGAGERPVSELGGSEGVFGASPRPFLQEMHCCWRAVLPSGGVPEVSRLHSIRQDLLRDPTASRALDPHHSADLGRAEPQVEDLWKVMAGSWYLPVPHIMLLLHLQFIALKTEEDVGCYQEKHLDRLT